VDTESGGIIEFSDEITCIHVGGELDGRDWANPPLASLSFSVEGHPQSSQQNPRTMTGDVDIDVCDSNSVGAFNWEVLVESATLDYSGQTTLALRSRVKSDWEFMSDFLQSDPPIDATVEATSIGPNPAYRAPLTIVYSLGTTSPVFAVPPAPNFHVQHDVDVLLGSILEATIRDSDGERVGGLSWEITADGLANAYNNTGNLQFGEVILNNSNADERLKSIRVRLIPSPKTTPQMLE
jgi:hypothetical protein